MFPGMQATLNWIAPQVLTISNGTSNYNIYNAAVGAGWDGATPIDVVLYVDAAVAAMTTGSGWPAGSSITIVITSDIDGAAGAGGLGGLGAQAGFPGQAGGDALTLEYPVTIDVHLGRIRGGPGGGGGGGGGEV